MMRPIRFVPLALLVAAPSVVVVVVGLSADPDISRARLSQAFASPSGKLTYSPEVVIPEPTDPTAILLQTNAVQGLSEKIRDAKANAVFLDGSLTALKTFTVEQETARGNFPGPVPVVYCCNNNGNDQQTQNMAKVADAGAEGCLVSVVSNSGGDDSSIASVNDIGGDDYSLWVQQCQHALECGVQPIPEVVIPSASVESWDDSQVTSLVDKLSELIGTEPVAVVLTVKKADEEVTDNEGKNDDQDEDAPELGGLPSVPRALNKRIPIIGSVTVPAGDGRLQTESNRLKDSGFLGAFLRRDCVPGFRVQLDLEIVAKFWAGCITDLKSTRSKAFSFRSKNNMEKSTATQWGNYQKSVIDSGALGDPNESYSVVDEGAGEYKGFA